MTGESKGELWVRKTAELSNNHFLLALSSDQIHLGLVCKKILLRKEKLYLKKWPVTSFKTVMQNKHLRHASFTLILRFVIF